MEDWVELAHQKGAHRRRRFCTTIIQENRAVARAKVEHRDTDPHVMAYMDDVDKDNRRNLTSTKESASAARKAEREKNRMAALVAYELKLNDRIAASASNFEAAEESAVEGAV